MALLGEGKLAPDFSLKDQAGVLRSLSQFSERFLILYFYPKDDTPGCTIEARGFNKELERLKKLGAQVVGVSGGDETSKDKFCKKHGLLFTLLADVKFELAKKFGAFGPKMFMGRSFEGVLRSTFILNEHREVVKVFRDVKPDGHAEEVRLVVEELAAKAPSAKKKVAPPATSKKKKAAPALPKKAVAKTKKKPATKKAKQRR